MPTQTRHTQKPRLEEGGQSNQFASPSLLRTPVVGPTLLDSCLGHCLEHRRWAIILHEPSYCISRAIQHPWQYVIVPGCYGNCLFLCTQSALPTEGFVPCLGYQLPDCQGVSMPYERECTKQWGLPPPLSGKPRCLSTLPDPTGLTHDPLSFDFPPSKS